MRKAVISVFIVFHLSAFFVWSMPEANQLTRAFSSLIRGYMMRTGLWHGWAMFAPNPTSVNAYIDAKVHLRNGETLLWTAPRIELAEPADRNGMERWNQWRFALRLDHNAVIREDAARYVARLHRDPNNPPVRIELWRHWSLIAAPQAGDFQPISRDLVYQNHDLLVDYPVAEGDL